MQGGTQGHPWQMPWPTSMASTRSPEHLRHNKGSSSPTLDAKLTELEEVDWTMVDGVEEVVARHSGHGGPHLVGNATLAACMEGGWGGGGSPVTSPGIWKRRSSQEQQH